MVFLENSFGEKKKQQTSTPVMPTAAWRDHEAAVKPAGCATSAAVFVCCRGAEPGAVARLCQRHGCTHT